MTMADEERERIKDLIRSAFASVERPGNWALHGTDEGTEAFAVERAFEDKDDWRTVPAAFLDAAPNGLGSALSFFSAEAFRYFLPAYIIADLDEQLQRVDVAFHLCHGLDDVTRSETLNPRRFGERTWFDEQRHHLSVFTPAEAGAIAAYLTWKAERTEFDHDREAIEQALRNYWQERAGLS